MASARAWILTYWRRALLAPAMLMLSTIAFADDASLGPFLGAITLAIARATGINFHAYLGNNFCAHCAGDPVNLAEGELLYSRTDLAIPGMLSPLDISFRYRSGRNYNSHWGFGWYFPYEMRLFAMAGGDVLWRIGTGEEKTFIKSGSTYVPPADHHVTLTQQMDGSWILKEKGGIQYHFSAEGLLAEIIDRSGNLTQFLYETDAFGAKVKEPISGSSGSVVALDYRLTQIVGTLGKSFYFTYYGSGDGPKNGRLKTLSDDFSRTVGYDYDSAGNLLTVTSPSTTFQDGTGATVTRGRVTTFSYSSGFRSSQPGSPEDDLDHNLLSVTDDRGLVQLTSHYDSSDRVESQSYNGGTTTFAYATTTDGRIVSVDETDNNGFVHRHAFDANGNPTSVSTQSSGIHPTLSAIAFYGTSYTYDSAQQVNEIKEQLGNGVELTYDAQGNVLERRAKTNVTAVNGSSDIVSTYTYESTFNRLKTATDPLGNVTTFYYDYEEASLGDQNGDGITTQVAGNLVRVDRPNATLPDGTTQSGITAKFWYNAFGQLIRTIDAEGNVVERQYYPSTHASYGLLSKQIVDPFGLALTSEYTYDTYGFPATVKNPRNNVVTCTANAVGEIVEVDAPLNAASRATYDANGNVVKAEVHNVDETGAARTPEWIKSIQAYDAWDQLTSTVEDLSGTTSILTRTTSYEYDGLANLKRVTSPEGRVSAYDYDENGLNWRETAGIGSGDATSSVIHVDNNWRVTQSIDGRRGQTTIGYDLFDRMTSITDPSGNVSQADWNKRGQATERRQYTGSSTLGTKVDFTYDELGRMTKQKQIEVGGSGYSEGWFEFNKNSLVHRVRTPRGYFTSVAYDAANRRTSVTDPAGNSAAYTLDANGNPTTVTEDEVESSETFVRHATWDDLDRLLSSSNVDRLSSTHEPTTTFAYDSRSLLIRATDAIGRTSRSAYDLGARLISTDADAGGLAIVTQYGYDKDDLVTSLTDASSNTTSWDYDAVGRQIKATYPTGVFEAWTYDADHNVQTSRTQDGVLTSFSYQANNLLKSRAAPNLVEDFTWNGLGGPLTAKVTQNGAVTSSISYSYDGFGRRSNETQDGYSVGYGHDADHNVTQVTYPDSYAVTNGYDSLDRLSTVSDTGGTIASYAFDGPGRIHSRTTGVTETNGWDGLRRLVGIDAGSYFHPTYGFDDVNRRTYRKNNHAGGRGDVYGYDGVSRLSDIWYDATSPDVATTGYTSDFHVTQTAVDDRTSTTLSGVTTTYNAADSVHRYTQVGTASRNYDAKGNLTDDGSQLFAYDSWNRLTEVKDKTTNASRSQFSIDAMGRRTTKSEPGLTTRYVYAGARLVAEFEDAGSGMVLKRRYVYGTGLDEAVALDSAGQRYWCYQDALGSTEVTCNASNALVERYTYDAFGRPSVVDGSGTPIVNAYGRPSSSLKNTLWYAGSRWDGESGQYHMRARQYESNSGRFVSRDPLGYRDGPNSYAYSLSSPTNWIDPLGLEHVRKNHEQALRDFKPPSEFMDQLDEIVQYSEGASLGAFKFLGDGCYGVYGGLSEIPLYVIDTLGYVSLGHGYAPASGVGIWYEEQRALGHGFWEKYASVVYHGLSPIANGIKEAKAGMTPSNIAQDPFGSGFKATHGTLAAVVPPAALVFGIKAAVATEGAAAAGAGAAESVAIQLGRTCVRSGGKTIGLGLAEDLSSHAGSGAITWLDGGWQRARLTKVPFQEVVDDKSGGAFQKSFEEASANAGAIRFDLSGLIKGFRGPSMTLWEMNQVLTHPSLLEKTTFIMDGKQVSWDGTGFR